MDVTLRPDSADSDVRRRLAEDVTASAPIPAFPELCLRKLAGTKGS